MIGIGIGASGFSTGAEYAHGTLKTHADTPYTVGQTDRIIRCDVVGGVLTCTLPAVASSLDRRVTIVDWTGHAAASNITVGVTDSTINGGAAIAIVTNYGGTDLYCDGVVWRSLQATV
jgi:hypothetical protein